MKKSRTKIPVYAQNMITEGKLKPTEAFQKELDKEEKELMDMKHDFAFTYYEAQDYKPELYGKRLPEEGGWICIKIPPPTEIKVPKWSFWFAKQNTNIRCRYQITILTPKGELGVVPGEYFQLSDITSLMKLVDGEIEIHFIDENVGLNVNKLFYLMSRGLSKRDAILLLLPNIKTQKSCYFTVKEKIAEELTRAFG